MVVKNIVLLTDGEVLNKNDTLNIIENNINEFFIHSIGIENNFDEDLIKNAGILGKGNYNFCSDINNLKEIKNSSNSEIFESEFNTNLDDKNLYK